jgi:hypothetical protein
LVKRLPPSENLLTKKYKTLHPPPGSQSQGLEHRLPV